MKAAFLLATALAGCAPSIPPAFNTTEWARAQDSVFANPRRPTPKEAEAFGRRFRVAYELQAAIGPTNLTIRHDLIVTAPYAGRGDVYPVEALRGFRALQYRGTWREGASYGLYTLRGLQWYARFDRLAVLSFTAPLWRAYGPLAAPDGDLPLPEVAKGLGLPPGAGDTAVGPYRVHRSGGRYLLVVARVDSGARWNLHHHLEAGYFALWLDTGWVVRCKPYEGWAKSDPAHEDGFYNLLPRGAVIPNAWRLDPPRVTTGHAPGVYRFRWKGPWWKPAATREILVGDTIVVRDTWGWFGKRERRFP